MFEKKNSLLFFYTAYNSRGAVAIYCFYDKPKTAAQIFTHPFRHKKMLHKNVFMFLPSADIYIQYLRVQYIA